MTPSRARVKPFTEGLSEALLVESIIVIVDVFRASSTIVALLEMGVEELRLVSSVDEALSLRDRYTLIGEREGRKPAQFDFDNSPTEILKHNWNDKRVVMTTSNGTRGLVAAREARYVLVGSLLNAHAIAQYIRNSKKDAVIVPIGHFKESRVEDDAAANLIRAHVRGTKPNLPRILSKVRSSASAENMLQRGLSEDLEYCLQVDVSKVIPRMSNNLQVANVE
ncbi:MAG: 2-phosphosulfolactate phosphatase [Candidatus Thorarchaeota archaeon]